MEEKKTWKNTGSIEWKTILKINITFLYDQKLTPQTLDSERISSEAARIRRVNNKSRVYIPLVLRRLNRF